MSTESIRALRVAEGIRAHVTRTLQRDVSDRRLDDVVVTGVDIPADLGVATVHVRRLSPLDAKGERRLMGALERATGRIRKGLGAALGLKRTPALRFRYDSGPDAARRVEEILEEIAREPKGEEP
jgi:ribosome-binding factor A